MTAAYEAYSDMVYRIAFVQTKNRAQAEDIQQEVFLALVRYSNRIRNEKHLKAWLIRVAQNACRKHFRSLWIKLTVQYDDATYKEQEENGQQSTVPGADAEEDAREETELVQEMVEKLPESSRAVIHLFYYEEMSIREIAQALNITEQNVKTRLSRARDRLKKQLEERTQ